MFIGFHEFDGNPPNKALFIKGLDLWYFPVDIRSGYEHFHPKEVYYGLCLVPTGRKKDKYRRIGLFRTCGFSREAFDRGFSPTLTRHEIVYVEFWFKLSRKWRLAWP